MLKFLMILSASMEYCSVVLSGCRTVGDEDANRDATSTLSEETKRLIQEISHILQDFRLLSGP